MRGERVVDVLSGHTVPEESAEFLRDLLTQSLDAMFRGVIGVEVTLEIASPDRVRKLNREYRGRDSETDVLSFPGFFEDDFGTGEASSRSPFREEFIKLAEKAGVTLPCPSGDQIPPVLFLGEIVLDPAFARNWADRNGVDEERHLALLVVHSLLHLLGIDHETDDSAEGMELLEVWILKKILSE